MRERIAQQALLAQHGEAAQRAAEQTEDGPAKRHYPRRISEAQTQEELAEGN